VPLRTRAEPGAWTMPRAVTVRLVRLSDGNTAPALSNDTVRSVTPAGTVRLATRAWKSVLRTLTVVRAAPAKTTAPGKSLAPVRLTVLPAVTVKVAAPAPFRWVMAAVEVRAPVAAVALKVPRPRSLAPRARGEPLTTATAWVDCVAFRLTAPE